MNRLLALSSSFLALLTSPAMAIDAVPEPGLVVYGQVFSQTSPNETVAIASMAWNGAPGGTGGPVTSGLYPVPPAPVGSNPSYYVARVPFESPNVAGLTLTGTGLFDLVLSGSDAHQVGFTVTPVTGGPARIARIKAVNGVANPGAPGSLPTFYNWNDVTAATRGKLVRLDLIVDAPPSGPITYADWIAGYLPANDPRAAEGIDADGDGRSNFDEFAAQTNPVDPRSMLAITEISRTGSGTISLTWQSNPGQTYTIEYRNPTTPAGTWTTLNTFPGAAGSSATTVSGITLPVGISRQLYRVTTTR